MADPADSGATRKSAVRLLKRDGPTSVARPDEWALDVFLGLVAILCIFGLAFAVAFWTRSGSLLYLAPVVAAAVLGVIFGLGAPGDRGRLALLVSVALIVLTLAAHFVIGAFVAVDEPTAKSLGDEVVSTIEEFRSAHGRYPENLSTAGIAAPGTRLCSWSYEAYPDDRGFRLTADGYGFAVFYDSYAGCWQKPDF